MKKNKNKPGDYLNAYARYSSLAFQMLFIILTVVVSLLAVALAIYFAIKDFLK
jgi:flagellar basal body-associated protein FliL